MATSRGTYAWFHGLEGPVEGENAPRAARAQGGRPKKRQSPITEEYDDVCVSDTSGSLMP